MPPKYIPKAPIKRMISEAGGERISEGIVDMIGEMIEEYGIKLARKSILVSKFREDKTLRKKHLTAALNMETSN